MLCVPVTMSWADPREQVSLGRFAILAAEINSSSSHKSYTWNTLEKLKLDSALNMQFDRCILFSVAIAIWTEIILQEE